jgi:hypothetical protein
VLDLLARDLAFRIAPVNEVKIDAVTVALSCSAWIAARAWRANGRLYIAHWQR